MLQNLIYYYLSNTAVYSSNDSNLQSEVIYQNVSLQISASAYDTIDSGSTDFGVTVGDVRINIISGSILLASYPWSQTNLIYDYSSSLYVTSSDNIGVQYTTFISGSDINTLYYFEIINSSSLETEVNLGIPYFPNTNFISLDSSSLYNLRLYSGENKQNNLQLYNSASVLLLSSSWIGTSSYGITVNLTGSNFYFISASINTLCCQPYLSSVTDNGANLTFSYITGSCGTYSGSITIQGSPDQYTWSSLGTGSLASPFTSSILIPSYGSGYYRLISYCSGGIASDPSNIVYHAAVYSTINSASICIGDGTTQACDCTLSASVYFAGNFEAGTTIYSDSGLTTLYYDGVYPDISYSGSLYYVNFSESILIANGVCSLP
jgi:hypothetical protein